MKFEYDIAIVGGCGHIGLPLGLLIARSGKRVLLCDTDSSRVNAVAKGSMPFTEDGAQAILDQVVNKQLFLSSDPQAAAKAKGAIITVGTPVDEYMNPKYAPVLGLVDSLAAEMSKGQHILLRSTVFPGTSERAAKLPAVVRSGVHLSFCPERVVQGQAIREIGSIPQIVSGATPEARTWSRDLFEGLGAPIVETGMLEAELAKLSNNAWRYFQFAAINQLFMVAVEHGADFTEVYRAMTSGYARAAGLPTPGFAAGPCLLKDTMQLAAFSRTEFPLGRSAVQVNEGLPNFIVNQLAVTEGVKLEGATVGLLGMAFKAESDDVRDSLSFKLAKLLRFQGATVLCSDPYVRRPDFFAVEDVVRRADIVIIATPHRAYQTLSIPEGRKVVDVWGLRKAGVR
jgi:UDP-N-acetyl-D-mannosaminuronic acid dehydrogenase